MKKYLATDTIKMINDNIKVDISIALITTMWEYAIAYVYIYMYWSLELAATWLILTVSYAPISCILKLRLVIAEMN